MIAKMKGSSVVRQRSSERVQAVGARSFYLRDGVWVDSDYKESMKTLTVEYGSSAYFTLLSTLDKLSSCFTLDKQVIVVYKGHAIKVVESGGKTELTVEEIKAFFEK